VPDLALLVADAVGDGSNTEDGCYCDAGGWLKEVVFNLVSGRGMCGVREQVVNGSS
jgi:CO dehydrogenase nickel-insertion accessory protein CooC1